MARPAESEIEFGKNAAFLPVRYPNLNSYYYKQRDMFWTPADLDMSQDRNDWDELDEPTQQVLKFVLYFFAQADGLVIENIAKRFQDESGERYKEAGNFYVIQNAIELIHNEVYSSMIETFITDPEERDRALNAIDHVPSIRAIGLWMKTWMESDRPLHDRVVAFGCIESIVFVAFFVVVWYVKRRNVLPGLCKANEFIARDEALHALFAAELYRTMRRESPGNVFVSPEADQRTAHETIRAAVDLADLLVRAMLPAALIGLNAADLSKYVRATADAFSVQLGYSKIYDAQSPFEWMAAIGMSNRTNFFEARVSEYSKLRTGGAVEFSTSAAF